MATKSKEERLKEKAQQAKEILNRQNLNTVKSIGNDIYSKVQKQNFETSRTTTPKATSGIVERLSKPYTSTADNLSYAERSAIDQFSNANKSVTHRVTNTQQKATENYMNNVLSLYDQWKSQRPASYQEASASGQYTQEELNDLNRNSKANILAQAEWDKTQRETGINDTWENALSDLSSTSSDYLKYLNEVVIPQNISAIQANNDQVNAAFENGSAYSIEKASDQNRAIIDAVTDIYQGGGENANAKDRVRVREVFGEDLSDADVNAILSQIHTDPEAFLEKSLIDTDSIEVPTYDNSASAYEQLSEDISAELSSREAYNALMNEFAVPEDYDPNSIPALADDGKYNGNSVDNIFMYLNYPEYQAKFDSNWRNKLVQGLSKSFTDPLDYDWKYMTQEEKEEFNNAYMQGEETAERFLASLRSTGVLNRRKAAAQVAEYANDTENYPILTKGVTFGTNAANAIVAPVQLIADVTGLETDPNSSLYDLNRFNTTVRGTFNQMANEVSPVLGFVDNVLTSWIDNLIAVGISKGVVGASGIAGEAANKWATGLTQSIMSSNSASNALYESLQSGDDQTTAVMKAIASGGIEALTEKYSIETLLGDPTGAWKYFAKNFFAEGSEEVASDLLNPIADKFISGITGSKTDIEKEYNSYLLQGYSDKEASDMVMKGFVKDLVYDFFAGAFAGGLGASTFIASNAIQGNQIKKSGVTSKLVQIAEQMPEGSQSRRYADAVKRTGSNYATSQLYTSLMQDMGSASQETITKITAAELAQQLQDEGETGDSKGIANSILKVVNNETLTEEERNALVTSKRGAKLMDSMSMVSQRDSQELKIYREAYTAGFYGRESTQTMNQTYYQAGVEAAQRAEQRRLDAVGTGKAGTGKVSYIGTVTSDAEINTKNSMKISENTFSHLEEQQQSAASAIQAIAKATSLNFVLYEGQGDDSGAITVENGKYEPMTNTLYIDLNSGKNREGQGVVQYTVMQTVAHEATHFIEHNSKSGYATLQNLVRKTLEERGQDFDALVRQKVKVAERSGIELTREGAVAEVIADSMEMITPNSKAFQQLAQKDRSLASKIKDFMSGLLSKIRKALGNVGAQHPEAKALMEADQYVAGLQEAWDNALVEAVETMRKGSETETSTTTGDSQHSLRDSEYLSAVENGDMDTAQRMVDEAAKDAGYTIRAYHGTGRADRVGTVFRADRATSGPMAFFTSDPQIAANYARDKADTSLAYDEEYSDYYTQFRVNRNGKSVAVKDLWRSLPFSEKQKIKEAGKHITWDDDMENIIWDDDAETGIGNWDNYTLREHNGNALAALVDSWLESGELYGNEGEFLKVLELAGIKDAEYRDPDARHEKVYDTYLKIQNPFNTATVDEAFINGYESWYQQQPEGKYDRQSADADMWDKNSMTAERFVDRVRDDLANGTTNAWTSIPDSVTDYLKSMGHDGIQDVGGKQGGDSHTVWIPFTSEQIKDASPVTYDDAGKVIPLSERFDQTQQDIRYSPRENGKLTQKQYESFGWVRENNVLSKQAYASLMSKYSAVKKKMATAPKTPDGYYVVETGDEFGINKHLVLIKGSETTPVIGDIYTINRDNETQIDIVRRVLYEKLQRTSALPHQVVTGLGEDGLADVFTRESAASYYSYAHEYTERKAGSSGEGTSGTIAQRNNRGRNAGKSGVKFSLRDLPYTQQGTDFNPERASKSEYGIDWLSAWTRWTNSKNGMSRAGYAMFSKQSDINGELDRGSMFGNTLWIYYGKDAVSAADDNFTSLLRNALERSYNDESYSMPDDLREAYETDADEVISLFDPQDIVDSAAAYDNEDWVQWLWNEVLEPNGIYAIKTRDGALVFDESLMEKHAGISKTDAAFDALEYQQYLSEADQRVNGNRAYSLRTETEAELTDEYLANMSEEDVDTDAERLFLKQYQTLRADYIENKAAYDEAVRGMNNLQGDELIRQKNRVEILKKRVTRSLNKFEILRENTEENALTGKVAKFVRENIMGKSNADIGKLIDETEAEIKRLTDLAEAPAEKLAAERKRLQQLQSKPTQQAMEERSILRTAQKAAAMERRIGKTVRKLNNMLLHETDYKNVPEELKGFVANVVKTFGTDFSGVAFSPAKAASIVAMYDHLQTSDDSFMQSAFDQDISDMFHELIDHAELYQKLKNGTLTDENGKPLSRKARAELRYEIADDVNTMVSYANTMVKRSTETRVNGRKKMFADIADNAISEMMERPDRTTYQNKIGDAASWLERAVVTGNTTPVYFFDQLGNTQFKNLFKDFQNGQEKWAFISEASKKRLQEFRQAYNYDAWSNADSLTFTTQQGHEITLTKEQALWLYATWKREHSNPIAATEHLTKGGFVYEGNKGTATGKGVFGQKAAEITTGNRITEADMKAVNGYLTEQEKGYADAMVNYLSTEIGALGNETSMELFGIRKYKEGYYFPYATARDQRFQKSASGGGATTDDSRIKHASFTHALTKGAATTLVMGNFTDVVANHIGQMALYSSMTLPIENMNRVLNYRFDTEDGGTTTMRSLIRQKYGSNTLNYMERFLRDMNGGIRGTDKSAFQKTISLFKKSAVVASLSVSLQQTSAMLRAGAMMNYKYLLQTPGNYKAEYDQLMQHSGVAIVKQMGRFDTNVGQSYNEWLLSPEDSNLNLWSKARQAMFLEGKDAAKNRWEALVTGLPNTMDEVAWGMLWKAVKSEQADLHPTMDKTSNEFLDMCGERFNDIAYHTQVFDSTLTRSQLMRSTNPIDQMATAFRAEPTLTLNVLYDAFFNKNIPKSERTARRVSALSAVMFSSLAAAFGSAMISAWGKDDDDRTAAEKLARTTNENFWSNMLPWYNIPYISDIVSLMQGYDVERADMSLFQDVVNGFNKVQQWRAGNTTWYRAMEEFVGSLANFAGIPAKNLMRDARRIYNMINTRWEKPTQTGMEAALVPDSILPFLEYDTSANAYYSRLVDAYSKGNSTKAADIEDYLKTVSGKDADQIRSGVKSAVADRFEAGSMTEEEGISLLNKLYGSEKGFDKDSLYFYFDKLKDKMSGKLQQGETYSKFNDYYTAVETGKGLKDEMNALLNHGVEKSTLASGITSHFKETYISLYKTNKAEAANLQARLLTAYELLGYKREDKIKDIQKWVENAEKKTSK